MAVPEAGARWGVPPLVLILCLAVACPAAVMVGGPAMAQDDGDDDDDDDDDDDGGGGGGAGTAGGGGGGGGSTATRPSAPAPERRPAAAAAPDVRVLAERAADEIVVTGLSEADFTVLTGEGFDLIDRQPILTNGPEVFRLRIPRSLSLIEARDRVRGLPSGTNADFNHYYRTSEDPVPVALPADAADSCAHLNCTARALIDWPVVRPATCAVTVPVAVIDTGINPDHAGLAAARIELVRVTEDEAPEASVMHGTAVLSLLVGDEARAPGLVPEAQVLAIDVFTNAGGDQRADVVSLVRALDLAVQRGVRVANLSLAGPENTVLSDMLLAAEAAGVLVVAAAGNAGPAAPPAWPAAHDGALAVTAVDQGGRIYRKAQRGPHVDIAAPGVEVWAAASVSGVKPRTGTSFAAPHVTAAAALLLSRNPAWTPAELATALRAMTADAGDAGADEVFGAGILSAAALCGE